MTNRSFVFTSNVDTLFARSRFDPRSIYEIHGNITEWQCSLPCRADTWKIPAAESFHIDKETMLTLKRLPCPHCGRASRPNILMFDDDAWVEKDEEAAAYKKWKKNVMRDLKANPSRRLVIVECGAGIRVPTVRLESEGLLKRAQNQVNLIRINRDYPRCSSHPGNTISFARPARDVLLEIEQHIKTLLPLYEANHTIC